MVVLFLAPCMSSANNPGPSHVQEESCPSKKSPSPHFWNEIESFQPSQKCRISPFLLPKPDEIVFSHPKGKSSTYSPLPHDIYPESGSETKRGEPHICIIYFAFMFQFCSEIVSMNEELVFTTLDFAI